MSICEGITSCDECVQSSECGFCSPTSVCTAGNSTGPYNSLCITGWKFTQCDGIFSFFFFF